MHHATTTQRVPWGSPLLVLCLLAFGATFAEAQQRNWDEGASPITSWTNATNWNANDVPDTAAEDAAFNDANGDDLDCVLDSGAITIRDVLMINDYDGTLTLNDALTCRDFLWDDTGAAGNVTVSAAGSLLIGRSADFAAGGTLTNNGTLTFNGATAGTWDTKAGLNWGNVTISKTGVAVTRGGTNSTTVGVLTINSGTLDLSNTNMTASSVVINGGTLILGGATLTVTGAVTINDGTLTVDSGTLDVGGLITVGDGATAAALTVTTGQVQAGGGLSVNALDGTYTAGTGTLTFDGVGTWSGGDNFGTVVVTANVAAGSALTTGSLTLTGATLTCGLGEHLVAAGISGTGALDVSAGAVDVTTSAGLSVTTYTQGTGTLTFTGGAWTTGGSYSTTAIVINGTVTTTGAKTTGSLTLTSGSLTTGANLSPANVVINGGTLDVTGDTLSVTGAVTINDGTLTVATGTLDAGGLITVGDGATAAALTVTNGQVQAGGGLSVNPTDGTYTAGTGTLTFDGAGTWSGSGANFGTVVVTANVAAGSALTTGSLTLTGATLTCGLGEHLVAAGISGTGALNVSAGAVNVTTSAGLSVTTYTQGTGTLTFNGAGTWSSGGSYTTTAVVISVGSVSTTGAKSVASLTLTSGTLDATGDTITVSGTTAFDGSTVTVSTGTVLDLNGAVTSAGGTINMDAGAIQFGAASVNLGSVVLNGTGGTTTFDFAGSTTLTPGASVDFFNVTVAAANSLGFSGANPFDVNGALTVTGTLTLTGATATVAGNLGGAGTLTLDTGSLSVAGTANFGGLTFPALPLPTGTVTLDGAGQTLTPATGSFFNLTINQAGAGNVVTVATNALGVLGTLTVTRGELRIQTSTTVTTGTTVASNGTLTSTATGVTHTFLGGGLDVSASGVAQFQPGGAGGMTVIFGDGSTSTIAGTLTVAGVTGGAANYVTLRDQSATSDATKWNITPTGTVSVTRARVQDSNASATINANTSVNLGGNTNWTFLAKTTRWISAVPGNWNVAGNWSDEVPVDGDTVEFSSAANGDSTVNIAGLDLASINMSAAGSYSGTLTVSNALHTTGAATLTGTVSANAGLTIDGTLTQSGALNVAAGVTLQVGGNATCNGSLSLPGTALGDFNGTLNLNGTTTVGGTLDVEGNVGGTTNSLTGAGTIQAAGASVDLDGMIVAFTGSFLLDGGTQALLVDNQSPLFALTVAGSSTTTLTVSTSFAVNQDLNVVGSLTLDTEAILVGRDLRVSGTLVGNGGAITILGDANFTGATAFTVGGSTLVFNSTLAQTLTQAGIPVGNVTVNKALGSALVWSGAANLTGTLLIQSGSATLQNVANNIDGDLTFSAAAPGILTLGGNTLTLGGDLDLTGSGGFSLGGTTLTFDGAAAATINPGLKTLGAVNVSKAAGATTVTLLASTAFSGPVSVLGGTLRTTTSNLTHTFQAGVTVASGATLSASNTVAGPTNLVFFEGTTLNVQAGGFFTVAGSTGASNTIVLRDQTLGGATWALTAAGTISVDRATVSDSVASAPVTATNSTDGANNTNWIFPGGLTIWVGGVSSSWSDDLNWSFRSPQAGDPVQFSGNVPCSMDTITPETVLSMDMSGYSGTLTLGNSLTVTGDSTHVATTNLAGFALNVGGNYRQASGTLTTGTGILSVTGTTEVDGTLNVNAAGGAAILGGNLLAASTGTLQGVGTLNLIGASVNVATCAVNFSGTTNFGAGGPATLTLGGNNDVFSGSVNLNGGSLTLAGAGGVTLGGALAINQDLDTGGRDTTVTGVATVAGGRTLTVSGGTIALNGGIAGTGSVVQSGGTVRIPAGVVPLATLNVYNASAGGTLELNGTAAQTLQLDAGVTLTNLIVGSGGFPTTLSGAATLTIGGNLTVSANLNANPMPLIVGGTTSIAATRAFTLGNQLTTDVVSGAGTLVVTNQSLVLTGTTTPFSVTNVTGLSTSTVTYQNGGDIRAGAAFTYNNLVIGAGNGTPAGDLRVSGNLTFTATASGLAPTTNLFFVGGDSIFDAGAATTVTLNQLDVSLTALTNTLQLVGSPGLPRTVTDLQVRTGELQVGTDWAVAGGTVGATDPALVAKLSLNVDGASLTLGGAGTRTLVVNDTVEIGDTVALGLSLVFNNAGGPATIAVDPTPTTTASLSFQGAASSTLTIASNPDDSIGLITGLSTKISAINVNVQDNDASGVAGGPIVADGISVDLGLTTNWEFTEGGSLRIAAASVLGDGDGNIDRVRVVYTQPIQTSSVGNVHERYELRLTDGAGNVLLSRTGASSNVVTSTKNNVLDIVLAAPMPQTHTTNLELAYTPPTSGFLTSDAGIPAATAETATPGGAPALFDAAAPVITGFFFQDGNLNGGAEALVLSGSEPLGLSAGQGIALSGFGPVTTTASMVTNPVLYLQVAGQGPIAVDLTPGGIQRQTGDLIAQRITQVIQGQTALIDPLLKPAFVNFSCTYDTAADRYVLKAGVPLSFDAGTSTYALDWARSTVAVLAGASDAAPFMRLGAANGGVEFPGFGNAQVGLSVSAVIPASLPTVANKTARFRLNGEDFRGYDIGGGVTTRASLASELQSKLRATTNQAQSPASQVSYSQAVVIDDTVRGRLVVVPGGQGAGVRAVAASEPGGADPFASIALVGSDSYAAGAIESLGADNTQLPKGDLNVVGLDGSNMLLGAPAPLLAGNTLTFLLNDSPSAGSTPSFRLADNGDGGFLRDRSGLPNVVTGTLTNLAGGSNVVLIGDSDGDLTLAQNPGGVTLDASLSVPFFGDTGTTVSYSWDYRSGPGPISVGGASIAAPTSAIASTSAFGFSASTPTAAGSFYEFVLTLTVRDASGNPVVGAQSDANGQQRVVVRVTVNSLLPVALAGPDQVALLQVRLDGSASFDPNGGALTYAWQATTSAGSPLPSTAFDDPTSATPMFTPNLVDTFTVTLGVTKVSNTSQIASDTVQVTIFNSSSLPPTADAGPSLTGRVNTQVDLDASGSVDPRGGTLTYQWTLGTAPAPATLSDPASATPSFTPTVPGTYQWNLVVRASGGGFDSDSVSVIVQDDTSAQPRLAPSAEPRALGVNYGVFPVAAPNSASSAIAIYPGGVEVTSTLVDPTGDTLLNPGNYDLDGLQAIRVVANQALFGLFYVRPPEGGPAPLALRFPDGQQEPVLLYGEVGTAFVLDGSASQDDGVITTFSWTQVSGPFVFQTQQGSFLSVLPPTAGLYEFTLVVTDNISQSSLPRTIAIPVIPAGNVNLGPPLAAIAPGGGASVAPAATVAGRVAPAATVAQGSAGQQFTLNAAGSVSNSGGSLTYSWRQTAGPVVVTGGTTTQSLTVLPSVPGAYRFEVTVTDQNGAQQRELTWVTVAPPGATAPVARVATTPAQTIPASGVLELALNGQGSSGTSALTYHWSQTRGSPVFFAANSGAAPRLQIRQPGIYTFELRVDDGQVRSAPTEATVFVRANQDVPLASGATTSKTSGGCSLEPGRQPWGWAWALLLLLAAPAVRRRRGEVASCA